jgi:hypothetical protein
VHGWATAFSRPIPLVAEPAEVHGWKAEDVEAQGTLTQRESLDYAPGFLDAYVNWAYRSMKSHRDRRPLESRLDAAESLPALLAYTFAAQRRIRPYNKYLRWELENHPLTGDAWRADVLLPRLEGVLATGDVSVQRQLFEEVERAARDAGLGPVLDAWGDELALLR